MTNKIESKSGLLEYINNLKPVTIPIKLTREEFEKAMEGNYEPLYFLLGSKSKELFEKALKDYVDNKR